METLATQARITMMLYWLSQPFYVFETSIVHYQSSIGQVKGLFILPGIVNRTFENRTQSNSIELNPWIEFD